MPVKRESRPLRNHLHGSSISIRTSPRQCSCRWSANDEDSILSSSTTEEKMKATIELTYGSKTCSSVAEESPTSLRRTLGMLSRRRALKLFAKWATVWCQEDLKQEKSGGATSHRSVPNARSTSIRSPPSALRSSSRSQSFPARQPEKRAGLREIEDPVMDLIKSAQSPPHWKERPAHTIASSTLH